MKPPPKTKKETPKPSNTFWCDCQPSVEMTPKEAQEHLKTVHNQTEKMKGTRRMVMHLDGEMHHATNYIWEIGGQKLTQSVVGVRKHPFGQGW